jgi:hypothetical protein
MVMKMKPIYIKGENIMSKKLEPMDLIICDDCNEHFEPCDLTETDDGFLCEDCLDFSHFECSECSTITSNDEKFFHGEKWFCESCFNDLFSSCDDCNETIYSENLIETENGSVCEICYRNNYFECESCENVYSTNDANIGSDDLPYCYDCYNDLFLQCDDCGRTMYREDAHYSENDDCYYCSNCYNDNRRCRSEWIYPYDYKPYDDEMVKHLAVNEKTESSKKHLFFGIEIEMENKGDCANNDLDNMLREVCLKEKRSLYYFKEDGSLNNGFELVTMPMSYNYVQSKFSEFDSILKNFSGNGFRSYNTSTCGIHIHITKDAISHLQLYKMLKLFYENPSFILKFSRRKEVDFNSWSTLEDREGEENSIVLKVLTYLIGIPSNLESLEEH